MQRRDHALTSHNNNFVFEVQVHFVDEIIYKIGRTQRSAVREEGRRPVTTYPAISNSGVGEVVVLADD
jgi:hypothetical protein